MSKTKYGSHPFPQIKISINIIVRQLPITKIVIFTIAITLPQLVYRSSKKKRSAGSTQPAFNETVTDDDDVN